MSALRAIVLTSALGLLLGLGVRDAIQPSVAQAQGVTLVEVAQGLDKPNTIVNAGDGRLFFIEQEGWIRVFDGTLLPTDFLDITGITSCCTERGLLGLAFHPNYPATPYFYVHHTDNSGDVVIARYQVSATDPNVANPGSRLVLLTIPHPTYANHNGGGMQFGPDGKLYIAVGDGGGSGPNGDLANNAQNTSNLLGKILRLDVNAPAPYIPPDNPFVNSPPARGEIWAYGLRNPWRISFDRLTGDLFIGDVGLETWEEVDHQPAGAPGGRNYGWRRMEGPACHNPPTNCDTGALTAPILWYANAVPECSITGGYRYRGPVSSFAGTYVYADYCSGKIWGATFNGTAWTSTLLLDSPYGVSTFGEDDAGNLYLADYFGGRIFRLQIDIVDTDGDTVPDNVDNCPADPNPGQENADRNFIDQSPPYAVDDTTWINSDGAGDECDLDDDNDAIDDADEPDGCNGSTALNPLLRDTDGDRVLDGAECVMGSNPTNPASKPVVPPISSDPDRDQLLSGFEAVLGTNPGNPDTDGDRVPDGVEFKGYASNPLAANTDGDGCGDAGEVASLNNDQDVNSADQLLLALEYNRQPPPPQLANVDFTKDGVITSGDQLFLAIVVIVGGCP